MVDVWVITTSDTTHGTQVYGVATSANRGEVVHEAMRHYVDCYGGSSHWNSLGGGRWRSGSGGWVTADRYTIEGIE